MNRIEDVVELVVNGRLYPLCVHEIDSLFQTEVESDEDESVSEESTGKEEAQHDVFDQVSEIGIEKTLIKTAWVVEESSTTNKLIANKVVRESEGIIVSDSLGDVAHGLKQDLLEDETVAIVDQEEDGINMGMNIEEMEQNTSMDIEQVKRHVCSDRHAHNALLNRASDAEVIEYNGTLRKVRSVSNVVLSFMKPEDRIEA
ncbi:hypothetical protein V6N12_066652 [Hibiscus sabdariffa]|uniref:Uncharacterized protein n=1 Tax=Hibiscus sabdariffa TaxID=183260 RepID=A0ABR2BDA9_9ROSI